MDMLINHDELEAMSGLLHIQQLAYLRGIRPYMDLKTRITGIKRRISYQSISEQLYIEPHQGIKSQNFSRDQVRRAVYGLVRAGLIEIQSEGMQLILKCLLASTDYSVQNKAAINPPQKAATKPHEELIESSGFSEDETLKADIVNTQKAAIPLIKDNYIYLLQRFDHFWLMYPEKKSRERAFEIFQNINPDEHLLQTMLQALDNQIKSRKTKESHGEWVPAWKFPANWLSQKCWEDDIRIELKPEKRNEKRRTNTGTAHDPFWNPEAEDSASTGEDEYQQDNVVSMQRYRQAD
ncbi:hypothetical protein SC656_12230 [Legionella pneumophila serogroup 1]